MDLYLFEATNGLNWGKFAVGRHTDAEWRWRSAIDDGPRHLLARIGWGPEHLWVLDLQTGEGAFFKHGGHAPSDLDKHRIWVCPMFEPFLEWLYQQNVSDLGAIPQLVELDALAEMRGYRRPGPDGRRRMTP